MKKVLVASVSHASAIAVHPVIDVIKTELAAPQRPLKKSPELPVVSKAIHKASQAPQVADPEEVRKMQEMHRALLSKYHLALRSLDERPAVELAQNKKEMRVNIQAARKTNIHRAKKPAYVISVPAPVVVAKVERPKALDRALQNRLAAQLATFIHSGAPRPSKMGSVDEIAVSERGLPQWEPKKVSQPSTQRIEVAKVRVEYPVPKPIKVAAADIPEKADPPPPRPQHTEDNIKKDDSDVLRSVAAAPVYPLETPVERAPSYLPVLTTQIVMNTHPDVAAVPAKPVNKPSPIAPKAVSIQMAQAVALPIAHPQGQVPHPIMVLPAPRPQPPQAQQQPAPQQAPKTDQPAVHVAALVHPPVAEPAVSADSVSQTPVKSPSYVEAFDWETPIPNVVFENLTQPVPATKEVQGGWRISRSPAHWPTLSWYHAGVPSTTKIPLISTDAGILLAHLAGASLEPDAGIVFGKIPAGWNLEFSGRSERPIFLDSQFHAVPSDAAKSDRYFALLNVEPGAHLLYVNADQDKRSAAVGIAVLSGTATYLDLGEPKAQTIRGKVLDAGSWEGKGLRNVQVQVVGQGEKGITDKEGAFEIPNALTVSDYPIFIETSESSGATHRYSIASSKLDNLVLYRLRKKQAQVWVDQLEGGVSSESGLIVGAVPGIIAATGASPTGRKLFPEVRSLAAAPTLRPETYTVAASGQLEVKSPLSDSKVRFVGVQVPEGPNLVTIVDEKGVAVWSELVISQPRIVNIVGPY